MQRVLLYTFLFLASACVNPIPAGEGDGSTKPKMSEVKTEQLVAEFKFPAYCGYKFQRPVLVIPAYQAKVRCSGRVLLTDDGTHIVAFGSEAEPRMIQTINIETGTTREYELARPVPDPRGVFFRGIGYPFLDLGNSQTFDLRNGDVREIPKPFSELSNEGPFVDLPGATDEIRVRTARRPDGGGLNPRVDPFGKIIEDPNGSGRSIFVASFSGKPSIHWSSGELPRFFTDTFEPAPVPGPKKEELAALVHTEQSNGTGVRLDDGWWSSRKFGDGWTNLVAQSLDGRYTIWGFSEHEGSAIGFGIFEGLNNEPLWTTIVTGSPTEVGFTETTPPRVFQKLNNRIEREHGYALRNILTGEVEEELRHSELFARKLEPRAEPTEILQQIGGYCRGPGGCSENGDYFAWYSMQKDGNAKLTIASKAEAEFVFQQKLEQNLSSWSFPRSGDLSIAKDARRVAVLSTDGYIRVFEY